MANAIFPEISPRPESRHRGLDGRLGEGLGAMMRQVEGWIRAVSQVSTAM